MRNLRLTLFTAGDCYSPSSRYRSYQFFPYWRRQGVEPQAFPLYRTIDYLRLQHLQGNCWKKLARGAYLLYCFFRRLGEVPRARDCDVLVIEHELFNWMPFIFEKAILSFFTKRPIVIDIDDASYVKYLKNPFLRNKFPQLFGQASLITAGSEILYKFAQRFNHNVEVIPTVIDLNRYKRQARFDHQRFVIGWIGGPQNARHIKLITAALQELCKTQQVVLRCIGAPPGFQIPFVPTEVIPWSWDTEIEHLLSCDVGINPLDNDLFSLGKCGFKLIQYMACGLPVVAAPVGANKDIVDHGINGFLAGNDEEWQQFLERLYEDQALRVSMGEEGRRKVEKRFSVQAVLPKMVALYRGIVSQ